MSQYARNQVDALHSATFALPASASTSTSQATVFDLGTYVFKPENVEVEISVPALSATIAPDTRTATYIIESSTLVGFGTTSQTLFSEVFTGAGGAGIPAQTKRVRLPSDCARYLRGRVAFGASMTSGAAVSATIRLLF
jgi:hypothetical protein